VVGAGRRDALAKKKWADLAYEEEEEELEEMGGSQESPPKGVELDKKSSLEPISEFQPPLPLTKAQSYNPSSRGNRVRD
jgi:hypothetical protein